jgi:16S rRNA processing protein RimM
MSALWPCGRLGRPHGLKGELALDPLPSGVEYLNAGTSFFISRDAGDEPPVPVSVRRAGGSDRRPLLRLEGVETREQAAAYSGAFLLAAGGALDDLPAYRGDEIIGLIAVCGDRVVGRVTDILQGVAQDILQIIDEESGEETLVPLVDELVEVDEKERVLRIREGLL